MRDPATPALVLASGSPRRRELLAHAGVRFEVMPADVDESAREGEAPEALVLRLAREKAQAVAGRLAPAPARVVLGADTIVVVDGDVLGKPDDEEHALRLLSRIVGRRHRVWTGVALVASGGALIDAFAVSSEVEMHAASEAALRAYVATGEPLDKAGAYAAQGEGGRLVARIEGSRSNVIGLPMEQTLPRLARAGVRPDDPQ